MKTVNNSGFVITGKEYDPFRTNLYAGRIIARPQTIEDLLDYVYLYLVKNDNLKIKSEKDLKKRIIGWVVYDPNYNWRFFGIKRYLVAGPLESELHYLDNFTDNIILHAKQISPKLTLKKLKQIRIEREMQLKKEWEIILKDKAKRDYTFQLDESFRNRPRKNRSRILLKGPYSRSCNYCNVGDYSHYADNCPYRPMDNYKRHMGGFWINL